MIIADTNLIVHLLVRGQHTEEAEAVYRKDPKWGAPRLWRSEFRNVLVLYLRRKLIGMEEAFETMEQAERLMGGAGIRGRIFPRPSAGIDLGVLGLRLPVCGLGAGSGGASGHLGPRSDRQVQVHGCFNGDFLLLKLGPILDLRLSTSPPNR